MIVSTSPQAPSVVVTQVEETQPGAVSATLSRTTGSRRDWAEKTALGRANALTACANRLEESRIELVELIVGEVGKPIAEADAEVIRSIDILRYHAQQALDPQGEVLPPSPGQNMLFTRRFPVGVAGLITPWNFPLAIPLWKAAPALAHGNSVLLKPASDAVAVALLLQSLMNEILPAGVFLVFPGEAEVANAIIDASDVVSFTGSEYVGRQVIQKAVGAGTPVQAEMSGLNSSIVLPDAGPATAAMIVASAMGFGGQKCTATSRIILVGDCQATLDEIVELTKQISRGDPALPSTVVGPLISERARTLALAAATEARDAGAKFLTGGDHVGGPGWHFAPTLIAGLPTDHPLHEREVFAPFAIVSRVDTFDEAIALVNTTAYGLVTSVYTSDLNTSLRALATAHTGMVRINAPTTFVDFHAPFGGEGSSSWGMKEQGKSAMNFYTTSRTMTVNLA